MPVALITGASRGLGNSLALELARRGWSLVVDARTSAHLGPAVTALEQAGAGAVHAISGSVAAADHRDELLTAVAQLDRLDLLVNNASLLGPSPQPRLGDYPLDWFEQVYAVNVVAPLALTQLLLATLRASHGRIVNISSDAAVEPYDGWGGYGSSKAALDQLTAILGAEEPELRVYALDPGDMQTAMQQQAFPGEDISDRPLPDSVVPAVVRLIEDDLPSGRYRASELLAAVSADVVA
ncbi:MAG: SDR family NAD(P)-dependent oxidoreductase [Nocardioidaceae bacterium]|jgi:NAD(P)-dependent dehydrogenase (short-subunit alcohol dehydrogenase family)